MKIVRQIVTMLLSFCLMFLIMIICLLSGIPSFLNPDTYHEILDEANAYKLIQEQIQNSLDDMLLVNNIELKTLENFITVDEVKEFVAAASKCDFDIDISYNRFVVDAKSIVGVLGLDLKHPLTVSYNGYDEGFEQFMNRLALAC